MTYSIYYSQEADRILSKIDESEREEIIKRIDKLKEFPEHFAHTLRGTHLWSLRAGKYRILFELDKRDKKISIVTLGHRRSVYDRKL